MLQRDRGLGELAAALAGCSSRELPPDAVRPAIEALFHCRGAEPRGPVDTCLAAVGLLLSDAIATRILKSGDPRCPYLACVASVGSAALAACECGSDPLGSARRALSSAVSQVMGRSVAAFRQSDPIAVLLLELDSEIRAGGCVLIGRSAALRSRGRVLHGVGAAKSAEALEGGFGSLRRDPWGIDRRLGGKETNGS
jgi:hypothetical protein